MYEKLCAHLPADLPAGIKIHDRPSHGVSNGMSKSISVHAARQFRFGADEFPVDLGRR
jgi:hypothetical protein